MKKLEKIISTLIALALLLTMFSDVIATASPSVIHEADDALLLMLASHNMLMDGGLAVGNPCMAVVNPQASPNEVDILFDIYAKQLSQLDQMDCSENVKLRLVDELDVKLSALAAKAQRLEAERQNRRRGGLFRRFFRALGRATGWVVSKAMDATGKIVQYSIEEVGPQLIKDAVFNGVPLTGAAFRAKFLEMLRSRGWNVVSHKLETRRTTLASEPDSEPTSLPIPTQPASVPTSPPPQNQPAPQPTTVVQEMTGETSLTPEEDLNQGTHTYWMEGDSNMLGADTHQSGEKSVSMEFTSEGVLASFGGSPANLYIRTETNTYVNNAITLILTSDGFEYHYVDVYEVHMYYSIIQ